MSQPRLETGDPQVLPDDDALACVAAALVEHGVARVPGRWPDASAAWPAALSITAVARGIDPLCAGLPGLEVVGEFTVPPPGNIQRDFQALHFDFGMPRLAGTHVPVSRFTALYVDAHCEESRAATRIVPLRSVLGQRRWPPSQVLAERLRGEDGDVAAVEGIFARIIEAADLSSDLPAKDSDGFLCGMEFSTLEQERAYFARHGLRLAAAEEEFVLAAGEMLIFDNLTTAHGRRGRRNSGELHQLCIGFASLDLTSQAILLDRILASFAPASGSHDAALA